MPKKRETKAQTDARQEFERKKQLDDLKNILADQRVRDFLWRFLSWTQIFAETFNPNFGVNGHNQGRRAAGIWMLTEINEADFESWVLMQRAGFEADLEAKSDAENSPPVDSDSE